ncbi:MAG: 2-oxo acid dehydrogenase subunit E2, partial [Candidatus Omnitrophica bacterium]|nr:2-oxo acid dehydrogenase subunit E2 [Candidatus Omnitrophota bacterium]
PAAAPISGEPYEDMPLSSMRASIASRLPQSLGPIPHFYLEMDVDAAPLLAANRQLKELAGETRITLTDLIIKACAVALRKHPQVNSQFAGKAVRRFHVVNIGLAVAGDGHLLVPVIQRCEAKTLEQIAQDRAVLVEKGQKGRLSMDEMSNGTFTISNLGMYGITRFQAVINPPQAAILAVGSIRDEPVVVDEKIVPGKRMSVTLSCDHRVFDGAEGAEFMQTLKKILEAPTALCL